MNIKFLVIIGLISMASSCVTTPEYFIKSYSTHHSSVEYPNKTQTQLFFDNDVWMESFDYKKLSYLRTISTSGADINPGKHFIAVGIYRRIGEIVHKKEHAATIDFVAKPGYRYRVYARRPTGDNVMPDFHMFEETETTSEDVGNVLVYY